MSSRRRWAGGCALVVLAAGLTGAAPAGAAQPVPPAKAAAPAAGVPGPRAVQDPALASVPGARRVVVRVQDRSSARVRRELARAGGRVTRELPLVGGFAATLPAAAVPGLARLDGVEGVSADRPVRVQGSTATGGAGPLAPRVLRAGEAWSAGVTGSGVTVALVDTGVADVPDLAGRVVPVHDDRTGRDAACYDLSGTGTCADQYGHGTFMAGLIAGNGTSGSAPTGTAPGARVLSVKVAGPDGAADVSTVLAAIQWVVSFRDRYGIRVLNLSLGTDSTQPWQDDPLNYAVERAWDAGVLVVVAASNRGPAPGTVDKPGDDPWVVTAGAVDDRGTAGIGDDATPDFSSRGPTAQGVAKPDVVAPGAHVLSLRAPGSTLDRMFPVLDPGSPYRTGSGTSMAAALVSGVAALALQAHPELTPDQLKYALTAAARPVASNDPSLVGAGLVDAYRTATAPAPGAANAGLAHSTGRGDLGASRGSVLLRAQDPMGTLLTGRETAQLLLWDPLGYTTGTWSPTTWYTSANATVGWNSAQWSGDLTGQNWTGQNWTGQNWTGQNWTGSSWYGTHDSSPSYGRSAAGSASYGAWD